MFYIIICIENMSEVNFMNFINLYKDVTVKGSNYFKLLVEIANGVWVEATYFGNTTPKKIAKVSLKNDNWIVEIQKHQSRDRDTGRFKSFTRKALV